MDHLCALQRDFINLRLGTFIHWNSAAVQFHANPDIIDWEFDLENGGSRAVIPSPNLTGRPARRTAIAGRRSPKAQAAALPS